MVILESSNLNPEEVVRQNYIKKLLKQGFNPHLIVIEKKISQLPHLVNENKKLFPNRRIDILCYRLDGAILRPHLLIECKAVKLNDNMRRQLMGYNYYIKAPLIALVSAEEEYVALYDKATLSWSWTKASLQDRYRHL
jgi:hypothetical protein